MTLKSAKNDRCEKKVNGSWLSLGIIGIDIILLIILLIKYYDVNIEIVLHVVEWLMLQWPRCKAAQEQNFIQ